MDSRRRVTRCRLLLVVYDEKPPMLPSLPSLSPPRFCPTLPLLLLYSLWDLSPFSQCAMCVCIGNGEREGRPMDHHRDGGEEEVEQQGSVSTLNAHPLP